MRTWAATLAVLLLSLSVAPAADDVADIQSDDVIVGKDKNKRYFRIGPHKSAKAPKRGFGLLVILPGGSGSADFHAFCKRIFKHALPKDFVAVQPVSVEWKKGQFEHTVWPTAKKRVNKMKFTTEEFVDAVIKDAKKWQKIDPKRVYVLCWSSSGPPAYAISLTKGSQPVGYFVVMSVFYPQNLPKLKRAKGKAYYIAHSKTDETCEFKLAKDAEKQLKKNGAKVAFTEYEGGHRWPMPVYPEIRKGITWLEKSVAK